MGYHRPTELADALALLADMSPTILAGGTDLYPATDRPFLAGDILDVTAIDALKGVSHVSGGVRIGAATKWSELIAADLPAAFDALKLSAREVGSVQIQNSGTIGGNLCNASPAADGVPPLLVLDAEVELVSAVGKRSMPLSDYIVGNRKIQLGPQELLSAILIPEKSICGRSRFLKLGARKYLVISIAMVAVRVCTDKMKISEAAISIGSCSEVAKRLQRAENALIGQDVRNAEISADLIVGELAPIDDIRADRGYRSDAALEIVRRTVTEACRGT